MKNVDGKRQSKRVNFAMFSAANVVSNVLKRLAIPTGFEPVTIGLEGPKQTAEMRGFWLGWR